MIDAELQFKNYILFPTNQGVTIVKKTDDDVPTISFPLTLKKTEKVDILFDFKELVIKANGVQATRYFNSILLSKESQK